MTILAWSIFISACILTWAIGRLVEALRDISGQVRVKIVDDE